MQFVRLGELETASPELSWKLVGPLFMQTTSVLAGAAVFIILGGIGFTATGSLWYIAASVYAAGTAAWRLLQARAYARDRASATPMAWAWRSIRSAWATGAGWGAWGSVLLFEPRVSFVTVVIGAHATCMIGGAVRNASVRAVASGQAILTMTPLIFFAGASGDPYLRIFAGFVPLSLAAGLALTKFLHHQTLQLLLREEEKSVLLTQLAVANQELEVVNQHLATLVTTDALTNVANRRAFDLTAAQEWRRLAREEAPLSMLMMDVDHFKKFNDFYGHPLGDGCLRNVAAAICSVMNRAGDFVARYGGEEFVVLLPGCHNDGAALIADQILTALAGCALPHEASPFKVVTLSIGVACVIPNGDTTVEQLTSLADAALYSAKLGGRNRYHVANMPGMDKDPRDAFGSLLVTADSHLEPAPVV